jgi:hypothetical protein
MNMILNTTNRQRNAFDPFNNAAEIGMKVITPLFSNQRETILGTENEMVVKAEMRRRHEDDLREVEVLRAWLGVYHCRSPTLHRQERTDQPALLCLVIARSIALSGLGPWWVLDPGAARSALAPGYLLPRLRRWLSSAFPIRNSPTAIRNRQSVESSWRCQLLDMKQRLGR